MPSGEGDIGDYIGIMEKKMETTIVCWGCMVIMETKMETSVVYWGCIGILEKNMEFRRFRDSPRLNSAADEG